MGKTGINLLNTKRESSSKSKLLNKLKKGSILFLIIYIGITIGVFAVSMAVEKRADNLNKSITNAEKKIKALQKTEELEVSLKERIKVISQVSGKTVDVQEVINNILIATGVPGVLIGDLTINDKKQISMSASAGDEKVLRDLLELLENQGEVFSRIEVGPFSRDKTGNYNFSLTLTI